MHARAESSSPPSTEALLRAGVRLLAESSDTPRLDAELLLAHTLDVTRAALYIRRSEPVTPDQSERYQVMLQARRAGRPVSQLTGEKEFWSLRMRVDETVLTPRPESELLVERALGRIPADQPTRVLDLGTGSGAVALAIASERPRCEVTATDISMQALAIAETNARGNGIGNIRFAAGDWLTAVPGCIYDVIVTNPPYIADDEWPATDRELRFEPRLALAGGRDGLDAIRPIISGARAHLCGGGWLIIEHGMAQGDAVRALFAAAGFGHITTCPDLAGLPRVTEGLVADRGS
jgi:release factor glutamine methyltransferase